MAVNEASRFPYWAGRPLADVVCPYRWGLRSRVVFGGVCWRRLSVIGLLSLSAAGRLLVPVMAFGYGLP